MTKNQIEYLKLRELQRSNQRNEELTATRDTNTYNLGLGNLKESERHNKETEAHNVRVLGEQYRHNLANEQYQNAMLTETSRHNRASEEVAVRVASETERSNRAREYETTRSNKAREVETNRANVARELEEYRSNTARESENYRSNLARETENSRSNKAREAETYRSNIASERLSAERNAIQSKYNSQSISLGYANLSESIRHAKTVEAEQHYYNYISSAEIQRHNRANESIAYQNNAIQSSRNRIQSRQIDLGYANLDEQHRAALEREELARRQFKLDKLETAGKWVRDNAFALSTVTKFIGG